MAAVEALAECPTRMGSRSPGLDDRVVDTIDRRIEHIRGGIRRRAVAREVEGDRTPAGIDRLQLGQGGSPHRPIEGQTMQQHDRRPAVGRPEFVSGQAGVGRGRDAIE